uniref:Uncharacterized protein n=1 Tax=Spongospora subterranea TaxID=70186 RepID=A0A0H5RQF8_9EUKA|eukprot:CRZ10944.1 hypothetical protein [Spongospora subterranea]
MELDEKGECRRLARALVMSLCDSADSLTRLDSISDSVASKAQVSLSRLRSMQATQIDDMRWAQHLLDQSSGRVVNIQDSMAQIVTMCSQCQLLLNSAYKDIRRVGIARRHLRQVTRLMDLFTSIPERARALEDQVGNEDSALKRVYIQVRQLVRLRDNALRETAKYQSGKDTGAHTRVARHFDSLSVVVAALQKRVWENISDTFYLAEEDPATLIKTLEVIEMEDYEQERNYTGNLFKVTPRRSMMQRTLDVLDEAIGKRFANAFGDDSPDKANNINHILGVGKKLIDDLYFVGSHVVPCYPDRFQVFSFFESRYQKWLYARLLHSTSDVDRMSPSDILDCINWIQDYCEAMESLGVDTKSESSSATLFLQHVPILMQAYLNVVSRTLNEWVQKILLSDWKTEPSQNGQGHWSTSAPQDLFCILNQQLDLAIKRGLRDQPFLDVVLMCFAVLVDYQNLQTDALRSQGFSKPDTFLIAVVNNCEQSVENSEAMRDRCKELFDPELEDMLVEKTDDIIDGFYRVGTSAVCVVAEQMVQCVKEKVLPEMFIPTWLSARDGEYAQKIIATFSDYFADYESWISKDVFFSKLIQESIRLFVIAYCTCLQSCNLSAKKKEFTIKLHCDYDALFEWYTGNTISEFVPVKIAEKQVEHIEKIQHILDCEPGWVPLFFESVFEIYGADRGVALKAFLSMRGDMSSSESTQICDRYREKYQSSTPANPPSDPVPGKKKPLSSILRF